MTALILTHLQGDGPVSMMLAFDWCTRPGTIIAPQRSSMSVHAAEHMERKQQCGPEKRAPWLSGHSRSIDGIHTPTAAVDHS